MGLLIFVTKYSGVGLAEALWPVSCSAWLGGWSLEGWPRQKNPAELQMLS
jgi:hypothetical protein